MAKKLEFVSAQVEALKLMRATLSDTAEIAGEEFLASTLVDQPTPPRNTGELRNSGAVYIGSELIATTSSLANTHPRVNTEMLTPRTLDTASGDKVRANSDDGLSTFRHLGSTPLVPKRLRRSKLAGGGAGVSGRRTKVGPLSGKITVLYQAPHAALMHEWSGWMHEPGSGAHFISSKAFRFMPRARIRIKALHAKRMASVRRRDR
jgi:hypothetical protein